MSKRAVLLICLVLVVLTVAAYSRVLLCGFTNYDDDKYVTANPHIQSLTWHNLAWSFNSGYASNWHPLTWMSHMIDYRLFGSMPMGHHAINLLFHVANVVLLLLVLRRMTGSLWRSAFVAALFAVHPLHVESVAWIAERKNVLSTFLWLLTMGAYLLYAEKPSMKRYLPVFFLFVLGLMAKPMLVTLPIVLLLLDYWPLGRLRQGWNLVWEKLPLFTLAILSSAMTMIAQSKGQAITDLEALPLGTRIGNALVSYASYVGKMVWPTRLAVFYPYPKYPHLMEEAAVAAIVLVGISVFIFKFAGKKPYLSFGWLWYLITLAPVIGVVQVGLQSMADRYTYVPLIGLFIMVSWGSADFILDWERKTERRRRILRQGDQVRGVVAITACLVLVILAMSTWVQAGYWHDSATLFEHAIAVTDGNFLAHLNLGSTFAEQGKVDAAIEEYHAAVAIRPTLYNGYYDLGTMLAKRGDTQEAIDAYRQAIQLDSDVAEAHSNLGLALKDQRKIDDAISEYQEAISLKPSLAEAHGNLAIALCEKGKYAEGWKEVHLCRKYGGSPVPGFLHALAQRMPDPEN